MLRLTLRAVPPLPVEAECLRPDALVQLSAADVARLPLLVGNRVEPLGEFFDSNGDPSDGEVTIVGDCSRFKHVGTGMAGGRITVDGCVGMHAGARMRGGELIIDGDAGDWLGAEMIGGLLRVRGNAGDSAGSAYRAARRGMTGGTLIIHGDAGHELGATMRRGLIAVGGRVGDFAGVSMIAGTLLLCGDVGRRAGAGMKRGSIITFRDVELPPTFAFDCEITPTFLPLFLRRLRQWDFTPPDVPLTFRRHTGDRLALGKGEILTCLNPS